MLRKDLIKKSPVSKILGEEAVIGAKFGAVLSRAGVGKTQFLVQIGLSQLLNNKKILHISLSEHMDKINIRYREGYNSLVDSIGYVDPQKAFRLFEDINLFKVGISYNETTFTPEKIRDYLKSFKKDDIEMPSVIIMDGLDFDKDLAGTMDNLAVLSSEFSIPVWFSIKTHREQALCPDGYPVQLENYKDRFDKALFLKPRRDKIEATVLKDGNNESKSYFLAPATMMIE